MKLKITKGKWYYSYTDGRHSVLSDSVYYPIVGVFGNEKEDKANAILMSKAPEMLDELIKEVEILNSIGLGYTDRCIRKEKLIKQATEL